MSDAVVNDELKSRIKRLIVERLKLEIDPETIDDATPLFGDSGLGLDSIDALEMVLAIEQELGVRIEDEEVGSKALSSIEALARFVESEGAAG
ncbi:MAG: phosphopantetheine-binding protein [Holophagales bacterium]|nr:phosphopantetheine-binding protein [Holophagales bacterium]